jgi:DNA-binding transcriptional ArsR family regulator
MVEIAALVGDPARANILSALMGGRALTAKELACAASVSPQTTSGHLGKLAGANLVTGVKQGRHRYFRIATPQVAEMLEAIMEVAAAAPPRYRPPSKADDAMRAARTCYDHVAGLLGVRLADRLAERELIILGAEAGEVTPLVRNSCRSWASTCPRHALGAAYSAARAWTGLSGGHISEVRSGRLWRAGCSNSNGLCGCARAEPS